MTRQMRLFDGYLQAALGPGQAQFFGHEERQFQRLAGVEARVAIGVVAIRQAGLGDRGGAAAHAFGDIVAGHLDMDAAGIGAQRAMGGKGTGYIATGGTARGMRVNKNDSTVEAIGKNILRAATQQAGRQIARGILGALLK